MGQNQTSILKAKEHWRTLWSLEEVTWKDVFNLWSAGGLLKTSSACGACSCCSCCSLFTVTSAAYWICHWTESNILHLSAFRSWLNGFHCPGAFWPGAVLGGKKLVRTVPAAVWPQVPCSSAVPLLLACCAGAGVNIVKNTSSEENLINLYGKLSLKY